MVQEVGRSLSVMSNLLNNRVIVLSSACIVEEVNRMNHKLNFILIFRVGEYSNFSRLFLGLFKYRLPFQKIQMCFRFGHRRYRPRRDDYDDYDELSFFFRSISYFNDTFRNNPFSYFNYNLFSYFNYNPFSYYNNPFQILQIMPLFIFGPFMMLFGTYFLI